MGLLSQLIFLPLAGALLVLLIPGKAEKLIRVLTMVVMLLLLVLSGQLIPGFIGDGTFEFNEAAPWIPSFGINYHVGVDGISLLLLLLTTFLAPIVYLSTWSSISSRVKEFSFFYMLLQAGMVGTFVALDLFLFYLFWELMLIPMVFLIGVWGGPRKIYAAVKFMLYTMVGSLLMLVAILFLVKYAAGVNGYLSFDFNDVLGLSIPFNYQIFLFGAFALAFAVKVPLFPFHTWLPDAHVEAPTAASAILAGVLLKMGTYGFIRFAMPLFPEATHYAAPVIITMSLIGIVYAALVAMVQEDAKKLVAYSSVSHLGYVILGLFAFNVAGISGGIFTMISHGLTSAALFLLVGVIYERRHTRMISDYGGIARTMPVYSTIFLIVTLGAIGLPGTSGFVGEFLVLVGVFKASPLLAAIAALGVIFGAVYMLWLVRRVFFGPVTSEENRSMPDLTLRELIVMLPLVIGIIVMGVRPAPLLDRMEKSVELQLRNMGVVELIDEKAPADVGHGHGEGHGPAPEGD